MRVSKVECWARVEEAGETWVCEIFGRRVTPNQAVGHKIGERKDETRVANVGNGA
jgi:hypothetical protein